MYVCLCRGVTDETVVDAVRRGARSLAEVGRACGAGRTCGGCRPEIRRLMSEVASNDRSVSGPGRLEIVGGGHRGGGQAGSRRRAS